MKLFKTMMLFGSSSFLGYMYLKNHPEKIQKMKRMVKMLFQNMKHNTVMENK